MKKSICLNMIVKDESNVIQKCLNSVKHLIDHWVIVDTGSTDQTKKIIQETLKGIPGQLYDRPWVNFEHNRNEALRLAKNCGDYLLFIDADEQLHFSKKKEFPPLEKHAYVVNVSLINQLQFHRVLLVDNHINWVWEGVLHEQLHSEEGSTLEILEDPILLSPPTGTRSRDPEKFLKDIQILKEALEKNPNDSRNVFFLAQSYVGAGLERMAIPIYQKRIEMDGWEEEVYYSYFSIGLIQYTLKMGPELFIPSFFMAYRYRSSRAEPLFWVADHYMSIGKFNYAYPIIKEGLLAPYPADGLLVDHKVYDHALLWQFIICSWELGKLEEAYDASKEILKKRGIPPEVRKVIVQKIGEKHPSLAE